MELDVNDRIIKAAKPADVIAAIDGYRGEADWFVNLSDDDGDIEAFARGGGRFRLTYHDGKSRFEAADTVDAAALKAMLLAYLRGEKSWRDARVWQRKPSGKKAAEARGEPPVWAIVAVVASIALIFVISELPDSWKERLPFANSTFGPVVLIFLPMAVMLVALIVNGVLKVRQAKGWAQAQGRITRSRMASRSPPAGSTIGKTENVPDVSYSFSVRGRNYQGNRVSLGNISGPFADEALKRYPVGATVTVYYDPADPDSNVLERGAPKGIVKGCGGVIAFFGVIGAGIYWAFTRGPAALRSVAPDADVPVTLFAAGFGLAALVFFLAYRRHLRRANAWPVVPGEIVESRVEERGSLDSGPTRRTYVPIVEFRYEVGGQSYASRQVAVGLAVSGSRSVADRVTGRYPLGAKVEVHYDPANPSDAALENPTRASWVLLGIAAACFAVALYTSRILH
ncbi:DUF3592 domain-containing protein [Bosea beijingensis]|uniref:DUF3592 domain-containing protein n=1 Tax=Bosea beijingensis TaxID=3068632 RepID=UPI0027415BD7|nr:DUF3592 domain-containing protein [Bosea sp. REN20]